VGGQTKSSKKITLAGKYPGMEVDATVPKANGSARSRVYMVKGRLYQMLVLGENSFVDSADTGKFLDSLQIISE
jgi:hypothetical protein